MASEKCVLRSECDCVTVMLFSPKKKLFGLTKKQLRIGCKFCADLAHTSPKFDILILDCHSALNHN